MFIMEKNFYCSQPLHERHGNFCTMLLISLPKAIFKFYVTLFMLISCMAICKAQELIARDAVNDLASDDEGRIFWNKFGFTEGGEQGAVRRINTATGLPMTLHSSPSPQGLVLTSFYALFFEGSNLMRMSFSGRITDILVTGTGSQLGRVGTLTARQDYAYWSDQNGIHRILIEGGVTQDLARPTNFPAIWLAVDNTHIYWVEGITGRWEIKRKPLIGGATQLIFSAGVAISNLAVDETSIYWSQENARIQRAPKVPSTVPSVVFSPGSPGFSTGGLVVDASNVYWTEIRNGTETGSLVRRSRKDRPATTDLVVGRNILRLAQDRSFIFWSDGRGVNRLAKSPISIDLSISFLEITQGIQNLTNDVPLVADKSTFVRVYPAAVIGGATAVETEVVLHGSNARGPLPGSPLRSIAERVLVGGRIAARTNLNGTANFILPASWLSGSITLSAEVDPGLGSFPEINRRNNSLSRDISFRRKEGLCLVTVPVISHTRPTSIFRITDPTFPPILERFSSVIPIADIRVRELPNPFGPVNVSDDAVHTITWLRPWMVFSDVGDCSRNARRFNVGLVSNDANTGNMGGFALPGQVAWVKMMTGGSTSFETPFGGIALAHEIAHNQGWYHVAGCGAGLPHDLGYPYRDGVLDDGRRSFGAAFDFMVHFGFDRLSMSVVPPTSFDFMGYCFPQWINDAHWRDWINSFADNITYNNVYGEIKPMTASFMDVPVSNQNKNLLYVSGIFPENSESIKWGPTFQVPEGFLSKESILELIQEDKPLNHDKFTAYSMELVSNDGTVLLSKPFEPISGDGDATTQQPKSFFQLVPFIEGTSEIRIVQGKKTVGVITDGNSKNDNFKISSPKVEGTPGKLNISWTCESPEKANYMVQYSNNGGKNWMVLTFNHQSDSWIQSLENLPGGKNCLIRVLANAGLKSSYAISSPFSVNTHRPLAQIISPKQNQEFQAGNQIPIRGFGYDVEDGSLTNTSMEWEVKGIGIVGSGTEAVIPDLPPGKYLVTLRVMDSEGLKDSKTVEIILSSKTKKVSKK